MTRAPTPAPAPEPTVPDDVDALFDGARGRLVAVLDGLDQSTWHRPSLCAGWRVRDVVVHLLMPYEVSVPRLALMIAAARFDFDRAADRWATADRRTPTELVAALRATASRRYAVPGAQPPLTHLVVHTEDICSPLGLDPGLDPATWAAVLGQMTAPAFRPFLLPGLLDGLALVASDLGWARGDGASVVGGSAALVTTIAGRPGALDKLSGDGVERLRTRLARGR